MVMFNKINGSNLWLDLNNFNIQFSLISGIENLKKLKVINLSREKNYREIIELIHVCSRLYIVLVNYWIVS